LIWIFVWVNWGYHFTQDLSMTAVEEVLDDAYSGVQVAYSGSVTQEMLLTFNTKLKANIVRKKQELTQELKRSLNEYLKKKIDDIF